ncbi:1-acyl-sn-glycerol-3-phosphate acyltransferase [Alteromonas gilva]|uniref:1-acyl-sn-glycerol-3-phosphate acyltransferase n=1 Tax=Alteromonas gilva TaxID=2987522 RepID=A0ABT5L2F2_9ALTE|nr:1-acyl-sn-glycerol-3-phosphate acyltransferase [Alteromonas gilva]MDC8831207.1 1-acyl-sn-glycerol-3-phosphate acyltransferase [Alteromonas gilva]
MMMQSFQQQVPAAVPKRQVGVVGRCCQWWLNKRGWSLAGNMANEPRMVLIVAPHTSNWDFVLGVMYMLALGIRLSFFAKHTLFKGPLEGIMRRLGGLPVERSRAHGVVENMAARIGQSEQLIVALAPEGTRKAVYPWKSGFLYIAQNARIPVQCVGLDYQQKCLKFGPVLSVSNDLTASMESVYGFYRTVSAKYPQQTITEPNA